MVNIRANVVHKGLGPNNSHVTELMTGLMPAMLNTKRRLKYGAGDSGPAVLNSAGTAYRAYKACRVMAGSLTAQDIGGNVRYSLMMLRLGARRKALEGVSKSWIDWALSGIFRGGCCQEHANTLFIEAYLYLTTQYHGGHPWHLSRVRLCNEGHEAVLLHVANANTNAQNWHSGMCVLLDAWTVIPQICLFKHSAFYTREPPPVDYTASSTNLAGFDITDVARYQNLPAGWENFCAQGSRNVKMGTRNMAYPRNSDDADRDGEEWYDWYSYLGRGAGLGAKMRSRNIDHIIYNSNQNPVASQATTDLWKQHLTDCSSQYIWHKGKKISITFSR
jgi:hypothetical protein